MDLPSCLPDEPEWSRGNDEPADEAAVSMAPSTAKAASAKTGETMMWDDELNTFVKVCPHG